MHDRYQRQKRISNENRDKILTIIHDSKKLNPDGRIIDGATFTELQTKTLLSPAGLTKILQKLETEDTIEKIIVKKEIILEKEEVMIGKKGAEIKPAKKFTKGMKPVYILTEKGQAYYKGIWQLMYELLELKDKGSSYVGGLSNTLFNENPKPLPNISSHNISYPSVLENNLNTVKIQFNTEKVVIKEVINELIKTNLEKIPKDAKSVFAFKVEWDNCINFARDIKIFMDDIKNDKDFLIDSELEFKGYEYPKLPLLESYLDSADLIDDEQYKKKLEALAKKDKFVSTLLSFGLWANWLDIETLNEVTKIFKSGNDPLSSKKLIKKLVIKAGNGFYVPLYDYVTIIRILNHNDIAFRNRLREYETENRYRPDKSKLFKIQNEMRGKKK